jgi:hypothetical protein
MASFEGARVGGALAGDGAGPLLDAAGGGGGGGSSAPWGTRTTTAGSASVVVDPIVVAVVVSVAVSVVSHATTAAAVAAGRGAGEDGVGDAVSSSSSAAEDGEAADAATESLADGDGMSRPSNPALAKPPSSTLPLAFPTASPALPQLLSARNVPLGGDYRRSRGTAIVVVPAVLDRQRRRHHWQWRRCESAMVYVNSTFSQILARANNIAS